MRAFITLPTLPKAGELLPIGTVADVDPLEALRRAQSRGDALILLFTAPASKPILSDGKTVRTLDPCRPRCVYQTAAAVVTEYPGRSGPYRHHLRNLATD